MSAILQKLRTELKHAIPAIIYFVITFNIIHFNAYLMHQNDDVSYYSSWGVTLAALLVGKIIVVVNCFPFINAFPNKPMIYNIVWKLFVYNFFIFLVRVLEMIVRYAHAWPKADVVWFYTTRELALPIFWSTEISLVLAFLGYILFSEFARVLGKDSVKKMLFG